MGSALSQRALDAALRLARAEGATLMPVFLARVPNGTRIDIQHFFLCRVISVDPALRSGPEYADPARGDYDLVRVPPDRLAAIDLKPVELSTFLANNVDALVSEAASLS